MMEPRQIRKQLRARATVAGLEIGTLRTGELLVARRVTLNTAAGPVEAWLLEVSRVWGSNV